MIWEPKLSVVNTKALVVFALIFEVHVEYYRLFKGELYNYSLINMFFSWANQDCMHINKGFAAQMAPLCDWMDLQVLCLKCMLHASNAGCLDHGKGWIFTQHYGDYRELHKNPYYRDPYSKNLYVREYRGDFTPSLIQALQLGHSENPY